MNKKADEVVEAIEEVCLNPTVEDSSCVLEFTTRNLWANDAPNLTQICLPYAFAKTLHDHLGQYLARQQVFDAEFRNQPK